jgi:ATP-dependent DNA helicase HFM1/MER3
VVAASLTIVSGKKLGNEQDLIIPALLTGSEQSVNCYVMCDEIGGCRLFNVHAHTNISSAGTMREATVKPKIASSWFPALKLDEPRVKTMCLERPTSNMSKRRNESFIEARDTNNEFDDDGLEDDDLVHAAFNDLDFDHIENYANPTNALTKSNTTKNISRELTARSMARTRPQEDEDAEPKQLENGNWACNHKCKDKAACKHLCCKDGLDKPPKKPAKKTTLAAEPSTQVAPRKQQGKVKKTQTKLQLNASKMKSSADIQVLDLIHCDRKQKEESVRSAPKDFRDLHQLHKNVQKKEPPTSVLSAMHKKPAYCYADGGEHNLSFLEGSSFEQPRPISSDYGELEIDDLSTHHETIDNSRVQNQDSTVRKHMLHGALNQFGQDDQLNLFGDDDSVLGDAMIGLADSEEISATYKEEVMDFDDVEGLVNWDYNDDLEANYPAPNDTTWDDSHDASFSLSKETSSGTIAEDPKEPLKNTRGPFLTSSSSFDPTLDGLDPAKIQIQNLKLKEVKQLEDEPRTTGPPLKKLKMEKNTDQNKRTNPSEPVDKGMREKAVPDAYQGLEPWLYEEFGDIVEVVDNN